MSISIGIGIFQFAKGLSEIDILELAAVRNYGIGCGIESFEADVREGIEQLSQIHKWNIVYSLRVPEDGLANLAYGVYEELHEFECRGAAPNFFAFCVDLTKKASERNISRIGIFFASEWYKDDRIRFACGTVDELISILSMPGGWMLNVLNPVTGRVEEWDELPYFFDLTVNVNS